MAATKEVSGLTIYDCGCVKDQYWCAKHDIYTKQDPKDRPPHGVHAKYEIPAWAEDLKPDSCTCFQSAPCSFCTRDIED